MPLDAVCLRAIVSELTPMILGGRIDKVQQPARDQIVLTLRGNVRLLFNAGPNQPRVQRTELPYENPQQPPMFCMLLRKHLIGARILSVEQPDLERLVIFTLHATDELGQSGERKLIIEAMGRRANLILLDGEGRILDCMRRAEMDGTRALLPGLFYRMPTPLAKLSLLAESGETLLAPLRDAVGEMRADDFLCATYLGISPLIARELVQRACGTSDRRFCEMNEAETARLALCIEELAKDVKENRFTPHILLRDGKAVDFTYCAITQYGTETRVEARESFSALLDEFYGLRERQELAARRGRELLRTATTGRDRLRRKAETLRQEYARTQDRDQLRLCGDLLTANLYRMERGASSFTAENYYEEGMPSVTIPLDPLLSPQQNAAKYYKRYNKAKSAEVHLREQISKADAECAYLESVLAEIERAESEQEWSAIRHELQEAGYLKRGREKKEIKRSFVPRTYLSTNGFPICVGRSNEQNDQLTKKADKRDLWLHTQKIHGSHVILSCGGETPEEQDILDAAMLAAYYSQAQGGENIPVDYTAVKNVKKPVGARPGMVVYETYRTLYVTPDEGYLKSLEKK